MIAVWSILIGLGVLAVAVYGTWEVLFSHERKENGSGWVYFLSAPAATETPIKVGSTSRDPAKDRLPEIETMSPYPLRMIWKFWTPDRFTSERLVHEELAEYRQHGEWFDRDATLALIDHLKGEG